MNIRIYVLSLVYNNSTSKEDIFIIYLYVKMLLVKSEINYYKTLMDFCICIRKLIIIIKFKRNVLKIYPLSLLPF